MASGNILRFAARVTAVLALIGSAPGHAQQVRITGLTDVAFGAISNFGSDLTNAQNVCAHSTAVGSRYSVTASGSGAGGALSLQAGSANLAYEVQWSASSGQTTGVNLVANVAQGGFTGNGFTSNCLGGYFDTASLIMILRGAAVSAATAGAYTGTLTLLFAPN